MMKRRVTNMPDNARVYLPKALSILQEARIAIRVEEYRTKYKEYRREKCKKGGAQRLNLTPNQRIGLDSLMKRVKEGNILVQQTDKTGKFVITNKETYIRLGQEHIAGDKEITEDVIKATNSKLNGHISMLLKALKVGENWRHGDSIRETCINLSKGSPNNVPSN